MKKIFAGGKKTDENGASAVCKHSAQLKLLQDRASDLRSQLRQLEEEIELESKLLHAAEEAEAEEGAPASKDAASEPALHHRPSYSLLSGEEEEPARPMVRQLSEQEMADLLSDFPEVCVEPIGHFNHWDRRECAVANAGEWLQCCEKYMKQELKGCAEIPRIIHQIWIGPKDPPCLWLDTFRVDYLAAHPAWGYQLWSDEQVASLPMLNEKIYTEEKMWQCKADIVRLEMLWHYGGVYVDADMISVDLKSLDPILELGKETGFVIAYEPDTKDKPYSILGNSVIACTAKHPLIMMLMIYLKNTYYHKRAHIDVFAVTGPVMYTKCLVDTKMPISIADQALLYPAFHYVPNPDAINFSAFPKCLMFQFGYTCSGLEGYVKRNNRCKKARECPYHKNKVWPMGPFKPLPNVQELEQSFDAGAASVPCVIHQLVFEGEDSDSDPLRWRQTWWDNFCKKHSNFTYRSWSRKQLEGRSWFCANLYHSPLDDLAATALMYEVLFEEGGYYVPLSTLHDCNASGPDPFFVNEKNFFVNEKKAHFVEGAGGIVGSAKGSPACYQKIMQLYNQGTVAPMSTTSTPLSPQVSVMGVYDGTAAHATFNKNSSIFLGASKIFACSGGVKDVMLEKAAISWAYESQVPCVPARGRALGSIVAEVSERAIFIVDRELFQLEGLRGELPGLLHQLPGHGGWDIMLLGVEWSTGSSEVVMFNVPPGGRPKNSKVVGFIVNGAETQNMPKVREVLAATVTEDGCFDPSALFDAADRIQLWFGAEKYASSLEEARIYRAMPLVYRAFTQLAGHHPPLECEHKEVHGNLMKGMQHGRLQFEMIREPSGGIMFRAWSPDNSTNCEMKTNESCVEWLKVYHNHQVVCEKRNEPLL